MQAQELTYKPNYRFVDGSNSRYGRSDQSHAQRESARMRQWERRNEALEANGQGDPVRGDRCAALVKASRSRTAAASRNPVIKGSVFGFGDPIVGLKAQYTDPFEIFIIPIESKYVDGLLDFRKFHSSGFSDRGWVTH
jgi:hypothetical protein